MAGTAITVEGVSKRYRLGTARGEYATLRDAIARPFRRRREPEVLARTTLWALRDVSFAVENGETVGFIGRNGAGKSTLLKVLSRITRPTEGRATIHGRVGSLLEVGTGFHAELTGRENIYLNGAILGLRRHEIDRRFDEIVAFSEVEEFLDTPVKRYSSGMTVRLAFAVAAHLEPEILLVDEVLAVGDIAFQRKCLGKMTEVASEGRTVLFVSHNMAVIQALCKRGLLLDGGIVRADGPVDDVVRQYLRSLETDAVEVDLASRSDRGGWQEIIVERLEISSGGTTGTLETGRPAEFRFHTTGLQGGSTLSFTILDQLGQPVTTFSSARPGDGDRTDPELRGAPQFDCVVDELPLVPGRYRLDLTLTGGGHIQDHVEGAAFFDVAEGLYRGRPVAAGEGQGVITVACRWTTPPQTNA
jgi:lipopolysaccharide transport system ATP-binding protein